MRSLHASPGQCLRLNQLAARVMMTAVVLLPAAAFASSQLALDKGCYKCHGNPPKKNAPDFAELASRYAKQRSIAGPEEALVEKLRKGSIFGHIDAHERLSQEDAQRLIRWIIEGAR